LESLKKPVLDLLPGVGFAFLKIEAVFWAGNLLQAIPSAA
jgi:hypothetical protein